MKKLILLPLIFGLSACATFAPPKTEELQSAPQCTVWKDGALGSKVVTKVEGELAQQQIKCWVWNMYGCSYTDYTFKQGSNEIRSSLPPVDKTIGVLKGDTLSISMTGAEVAPFKIQNGYADLSVKGPFGLAANKKVEFNKACSKRQVALGIMTLVGK